MQEQWRMEYLLYVKFFNHLDRVDISNLVCSWPEKGGKFCGAVLTSFPGLFTSNLPWERGWRCPLFWH